MFLDIKMNNAKNFKLFYSRLFVDWTHMYIQDIFLGFQDATEKFEQDHDEIMSLINTIIYSNMFIEEKGMIERKYREKNAKSEIIYSYDLDISRLFLQFLVSHKPLYTKGGIV